ncbi:MAG: calcineurin [Deltaproteobacteria bacterium]|nr:calcineurin [Deltaproteobacteria bacterium]
MRPFGVLVVPIVFSCLIFSSCFNDRIGEQTIIDAGDTDRDGGISNDEYRLVAIGDLHGDITATREAFRLAGAIDAQDNWIGGDMVVVQVGDQVDRSYEDRPVIDFLEEIKLKAKAQGGALHLLNGNHETMNVELDFRYVHDSAWKDFEDIEYDADDAVLLSYPEEQRGRVAAFRPGGQYAKILGGNKTVIMLRNTVFVHGGLLPMHTDYGIDNINNDISDWMRGEALEPSLLIGGDGPVWDRTYANYISQEDCEVLAETLASLSATRLVVAHTVQYEINSACDGKVWRIDTGMSEYYGGFVSILEITDNDVIVW